MVSPWAKELTELCLLDIILSSMVVLDSTEIIDSWRDSLSRSASSMIRLWSSSSSYVVLTLLAWTLVTSELIRFSKLLYGSRTSFNHSGSSSSVVGFGVTDSSFSSTISGSE